MSYITNADIVPAANRGIDRAAGNFSVTHGVNVSPQTGHMPSPIAQVFREFVRAGRVQSVIRSYATPIAFNVDSVWIIPDVTYSATTSSKHATHLWSLTGRSERVPYDATVDDILRIVAGRMRYVPARRGIGQYVAA